MARTQPGGGLQFGDLPPWGKVAFLVAAGAVVAAGFLLPKWATMLLLAVAFGAGFVAQRVLRRGG